MPRAKSDTGCLAATAGPAAWMLALLVVAGLAARVPRLLESLWYDEIAAWREYGLLGAGPGGPLAILTTYRDPANHVLHSLLTWFAVDGLGDALGAELALRLPALAFSLATIVALAALGRRAGNARVAVLAATVAAVAPVAVLEGAEARGYSMMIFFAAMATTVHFDLLERGGPARGAGYALLVALGAWSHFMTVFLALGHWLVVAALAWRRRDAVLLARGSAAVAGAAAATALLCAPILDDVIRVHADVTGVATTGPSAVGTEGLHGLLQLGGSWAWPAALPGLLLAGLGAAAAFRRGGAPGRLLVLLLAGIPVLFLTNAFTGTWTYARFALFGLPGALLAIALGLDALWTRRPALGIAALAVLIGAWGADLVTRPPKQPLRDAAAYVTTHRAPGEAVLVIGLRGRVFELYAGDLDPGYSMLLGADLDARLALTNPAWVVMLYPDLVRSERHARLRDAGFVTATRLDGWLDWGHGDVLILHRPR